MSQFETAVASPDPVLSSAHIFVVLNARVRERYHASSREGHARPDDLLGMRLGYDPPLRVGDIDLVHPDRRPEGPLWQEIQGGLKVSDDLSPSVSEALGRVTGGVKDLAVRATELTPVGLNLLNGLYATPPGDPGAWGEEESKRFRAREPGLALTLSTAAKRRLGTKLNFLYLGLHRVFAVFPSQLCMIVAEIEIRTQDRTLSTAEVVEEALHILTNQNRSKSCGLAAIQDSSGLTLQSLLEVVLSRGVFEGAEQARVFTYTVLGLDRFGHMEKVRDLAFRCARHYTSDYRLAPDETSKDIYQPFSSVVHNFALEGAASVYDSSDAFLSEQFIARVRQSYLLLIVLACHEHAYLTRLLRRGAEFNDSAKQPEKQLAELIEEFVIFRLRHNLPIVSHLEMHNQTYQRLRRQMFLDELVQKATHDVVEAEHWLTLKAQRNREKQQELVEIERQRRKRRRQRFAWAEVGVAAFLMFGLTFIAFSQLIPKLAELAGKKDSVNPWNVLWPIGAGLLAALLRGWQVSGEIYEDPISEAMLEEAAMGESNENEIVAVGVGASHTPPANT